VPWVLEFDEAEHSPALGFFGVPTGRRLRRLQPIADRLQVCRVVDLPAAVDDVVVGVFVSAKR
jgi:hypothetical protein